MQGVWKAVYGGHGVEHLWVSYESEIRPKPPGSNPPGQLQGFKVRRILALFLAGRLTGSLKRVRLFFCGKAVPRALRRVLDRSKGVWASWLVAGLKIAAVHWLLKTLSHEKTGYQPSVACCWSRFCYDRVTIL
jgi:hypothetical protein